MNPRENSPWAGSPCHDKRCGFSLVELLVVIGIIAILISILLPAMAKVRRQANTTICRSNLRQCGIHLLAYANQNHGWLFPIGWGSDVPREQRWPIYVFNPPVWNPRVMLCPDDLHPAEVHSYILNKHLADRGVRYGRTRGFPADQIAVMGEKVSTRPDYYMEYIDGDTEFYEVVELYRHGVILGSNYLYLDLHVDSIAPQQARAAIDPWDVPTGPRSNPPP